MAQFIISIGREYGSGGHEIAQKLAEWLDVPFYDRNILDEMATQNGIDPAILHKYDEAPRRFGLSRSVHGLSNSLEESVANMQFRYLREKAQSGMSFVIVGRCAEYIFRDHPGLISIFISGDYESKVERVMRIYKISWEDAEAKIAVNDKKREAYHNHFSGSRWGDSRSYHLCFNSSKYPDNDAVRFTLSYVLHRIALLEKQDVDSKN